jgi:hypothetical protein
MAYNFLGLVNDVNRRLNEVELTSATFAGAIGFYAQIKDAVNSSINTINHQEFQWPFNHVSQELTLVPGTNRYQIPADAKTVDFDSFRIKRDNSLGVDSKKLSVLSYEEYLEKYIDDEYNTDNTSIRTVPRAVFKTQNNGFGVHPIPDKEYTLVYEYFALKEQLVAHSDVPDIPEMFRHVIVNGAMNHAYMFRGDNESAQLSLQQFNQGLKDMRSIYINRYDYVRDTRVAF